VKNGVPIQMAFGLDGTGADQLDDVDRTALAICFRIFEGAKFDMQSMRFVEES
jgi:hypothetical protein